MRVELEFCYRERGHSLDASGAGIVEREILRIRSTDELIVAQRNPGPGPEPPDWMVIDVEAGTMKGPLQGREWQALKGARPHAA